MEQQGALAGVKVADFSWVTAGPLATKYLADYGATVVRVESERQPCTMRVIGPYGDNRAGINRSAYYVYFNGNKYSLELDLRNPAGLEVARRLVIWSDVVVESFAPGVMERLGLGYDDLRKLKSDVIIVRTSNQGQNGPHGKHPGYGFHSTALCGFPNCLGRPDGEPLTFQMAYTDALTPRLAAAAMVGALDHRNKTGEGQYIDISQLEVGLYFIAEAVLDYTANGRELERVGNASREAVPHGVYRCRGDDSWCAITVSSDEEWVALRQVMGDPEWAREERVSTFAGRKQNEGELDKLLEAWTVTRDAAGIAALLHARGVPAGALQTADQMRVDPQLTARGFLWEMNHDELGPSLHMGESAILSETPAVAVRPAPLLGQHTYTVCTQLLGFSGEQFVELSEAGAFE